LVVLYSRRRKALHLYLSRGGPADRHRQEGRQDRRAFPKYVPHDSSLSHDELTLSLDRRYDSDYRTLESLVNKGVFGAIHEAEIHYDWDAPSWCVDNKNVDLKPGDGMGLGIGSHTLDQALALFGRPTTVTGFFRSLRPVKSRSEDSFTIVLQYAGDDEAERRIVTVKTKVYTKMYPPLKYLVSGRDGTFVKFGLDPQEDQAHAGLTPDDANFGMEDEAFQGELTTSKKVLDDQVHVAGRDVWRGKVPTLKGDYTLFYADLAAAVKGERELRVKPETSRDGIRIVELARESSETGKTMKFD
jgi:predicted dehydrogenase